MYLVTTDLLLCYMVGTEIYKGLKGKKGIGSKVAKQILGSYRKE